jgi:hypothetical protein
LPQDRGGIGGVAQLKIVGFGDVLNDHSGSGVPRVSGRKGGATCEIEED